MQAGNPAWDDFNKRRNAAIRNQGFTTKESAKVPVNTTAMGSTQQAVPLSQDATNAYLQSIGVTAGGATSAPQFTSAPQYVAAPQYAPQYAAAPQYPPQMMYAPQRAGYAPAMQQPVQEVRPRTVTW